MEPIISVLTNKAEIQAALLRIIASAQQEIRLRSHLLWPALYHNASLSEALSAFCRANPNRKLRILLDAPLEQALGDAYLLVLARSLPSRIEVRKCYPELRELGQEYWLVDQRVLLKLDAEQQTGHLQQQAAMAAKPLWQSFQRAWDMSEADIENRQMRI